MSSSYEQNLTMLNASYEAIIKMQSIARFYPVFKEIIGYTEKGPRILKLLFICVPYSDLYRDSLPTPHTDIETTVRFAQMDDFGNICWVDVFAYQWEGYRPILVPDYNAGGLKEGDPYPYVLHVPTCH